MQPQRMHWALMLPFIAVLIWSLNIAITRYVAEWISPVSISFYRWVIAFFILSPFMLPKVWQQRTNIRPHLGQLFLLSAFGMALYQGLAYTAAHYTTATNMGIINAFIPIFTVFVSIFVLKEFPNRYAILGSAMSLFGLFYIMGQGSVSKIVQGGAHFGDLLMLLAVFFYAFYGVFLKKWQLKISLLVMLYVQICFVVLLHVPFILWLGLDHLNAQNWQSVLYAGIFPSLIAPFVWMMAVQRLGPNRTSIFMNLMPVFTAIIASIWLAEAWTKFHSIGGVIILLGIVLAQKKNRMPATESQTIKKASS